MGSWVTTNLDAIGAGIVSSAIVVAMQVFVRVASYRLDDLITRRLPLKRLWGFRDPKRIYLVSGSVRKSDEADGPALLAGPDAVAVMILRYTLERLYPSADIVHIFSPAFGIDLYQENIVTIGGPINNECTRTVLQVLGEQVRFDGLSLLTPAGAFDCTRESTSVLDHGLILTAPNPFNRSNRWVVVAGCDTNGVLAAAKILEVGDSSRRLRRNARKSKKLKIWFRDQDAPTYLVVKTSILGNLGGEPLAVAGGTLKNSTAKAVAPSGR